MMMFERTTVLAVSAYLAVAAMFPIVSAAAEASLPGNPVAVFDAADPNVLAVSGTPKKVVDVDGMPFDKAIEVQTAKKSDKPWSVQCMTPTNSAKISKGDTLYYEFYARCLNSADESGEGRPGVGARPRALHCERRLSCRVGEYRDPAGHARPDASVRRL
jgi:hypothetical protein